MDEIEQEETANEVSGQEETANVEEITEPGPDAETETEQVETEESASEPDPDYDDWDDDEPVYLYETIYPVGDDGAITVVHEITLGDIVISTILLALIIFHVLDRLIRR